MITMPYVLNLVINGIPSIPKFRKPEEVDFYGFKPCYKWNTFNTKSLEEAFMCLKRTSEF